MNLSENKFARNITLCSLYVAQGVPQGFILVVIRSYMVEKGLGNDALGTLGFFALLPWTIKWIWGPMIDRYTLRSMGRRRPWILFAQLFMVITMVLMVFIPDVTVNLTMLSVLAFTHGLFASLQDVSVDALAVELLEEKERGRMNGFMFGSGAGGYAFSAIVLSQVADKYGLQVAMIAQAMILCCIIPLPLFIRERKGEKLLPWTKGEAADCGMVNMESMRTLFKALGKAFSLKSTLLGIGLALSVKIAVSIHETLSLTVYVQEYGWTADGIAGARGSVELLGLLGCILGGYLADKFGHKRVATILTVMLGTAYVIYGSMPSLWSIEKCVYGIFYVEGILFYALSVALFALYMDISWPVVAGTQFTAYMATMNMSAAIGNLIAGRFETDMYGTALVSFGIFQVVAIPIWLWFIDPHETRRVLGGGQEIT